MGLAPGQSAGEAQLFMHREATASHTSPPPHAEASTHSTQECSAGWHAGNAPPQSALVEHCTQVPAGPHRGAAAVEQAQPPVPPVPAVEPKPAEPATPPVPVPPAPAVPVPAPPSGKRSNTSVSEHPTSESTSTPVVVTRRMSQSESTRRLRASWDADPPECLLRGTKSHACDGSRAMASARPGISEWHSPRMSDPSRVRPCRSAAASVACSWESCSS